MAAMVESGPPDWYPLKSQIIFSRITENLCTIQSTKWMPRLCLEYRCFRQPQKEVNIRIWNMAWHGWMDGWKDGWKIWVLFVVCLSHFQQIKQTMFSNILHRKHMPMLHHKKIMDLDFFSFHNIFVNISQDNKVSTSGWHMSAFITKSPLELVLTTLRTDIQYNLLTYQGHISQTISNIILL